MNKTFWEEFGKWYYLYLFRFPISFEIPLVFVLLWEVELYIEVLLKPID